MDRNPKPASCPDCGDVSRRDFLVKTGAATAAVATLPALARVGLAAPSRESSAESAVKRLYETLDDKQKEVVALPLTDDRRLTINANWKITKAEIGSFFNKDQQAIIREVVKGVTSEDGYERFQKQMESDAGGFGKYSVAIFGNPAEGEFEFELTGRHLTMRADGNTKKGVALGGPIVYGHGTKGNSKGNLFYYQTQQANEVFTMLDGKQREQALVEKAPSEGDVEIRKAGRPLPGIAAGELSDDQKDRFKKSLEAVLRPYREEDVKEVMEIVEATGGLDKLHMAFFQQGDLDGDKEWDIWRIEGPGIVCHFRGSPHVHAYINVARQS